MSAVLDGALPAPTPAKVPSVQPVAKVEVTAADRLNASRARLRDSMMNIAHPPKQRKTPVVGAVHRLSDDLFAKLRGLPGAAIFIDSVEAWWEHHPLRTASVVAEGAARTFVVPLVKTHPFTLVTAALVAGAVFVASRPWRWLLRPALFIGLLPQVLGQVMRRLPVETMVGVASRLLAKRARAGKPSNNKTAAVSTPVPNRSR